MQGSVQTVHCRCSEVKCPFKTEVEGYGQEDSFAQDSLIDIHVLCEIPICRNLKIITLVFKKRTRKFAVHGIKFYYLSKFYKFSQWCIYEGCSSLPPSRIEREKGNKI